MAGLGFEDTELALTLYFSGKLGDDIPKPKHRDGRIVEFSSKGRRRLEHVTPENVRDALTCIRNANSLNHDLISLRYQHSLTIEQIVEEKQLPEEEVIKKIAKTLKKLAKLIPLDDCLVITNARAK